MLKKVGIIGVGRYLPEKILTNHDLEKIVNTSDEWITTRTGIKERRIAKKSEATSDLAVMAAKQALKDAKLKASDVELIIVATVTADMHFPSTACIIQKGLHATGAVCFDISAACSGIVYGIVIAKQFIETGTYKNALVIGVEKLSPFVDWKDRNTCVLFGDGAAACVLGPVKSGGIISTFLGSDGSQEGLMNIPAGGSRHPITHDAIDKRQHFIKMQGKELFKIAVNLMTETVRRLLDKVNLTCDDIDCLVPHQANIRILLAVSKKLGVPKEKFYFNIQRYGNMSSASAATALCEAVQDGTIKKGDIVVLDTFGAGLVWGGCIIKW